MNEWNVANNNLCKLHKWWAKKCFEMSKCFVLNFIAPYMEMCRLSKKRCFLEYIAMNPESTDAKFLNKVITHFTFS